MNQTPLSQALLMDIDGTLTPPRQNLQREMAEVLRKLKIPFYVAAGSHLSLVEPQFLKPLWDFGFDKDFDAFLSNGAAHYYCAYSKGYIIEKIHEFNFRKHLGNNKYHFLIEVLEDTLNKQEFQIHPPLKVIGKRIIDRGSMVNFSPIGRSEESQLNDETRYNRTEFVKYDKMNNYRRRILRYLENRLSEIIKEKNLIIMLGGETSFDLVIRGQDKTKAVHTLLKRGFKRIIFIGDALFKGGNDSVIADFVRDWDKDELCPVVTIQVSGWQNTVEQFYSNGWIPD